MMSRTSINEVMKMLFRNLKTQRYIRVPVLTVLEWVPFCETVRGNLRTNEEFLKLDAESASVPYF